MTAQEALDSKRLIHQRVLSKEEICQALERYVLQEALDHGIGIQGEVHVSLLCDYTARVDILTKNWCSDYKHQWYQKPDAKT